MEKEKNRQIKFRQRNRQYDPTFKEEAIKMLENGKKGSEVAKSLGISAQVLYNWQ